MRTSMKIIISFIAALLILAPTLVTAFAQPMGMGKERGHIRPFVEPILMGHGFALQGDQYHILHVNAIKIGDASPGFMRSLLWQKKNPEDIAREISDTQIETTTRGNIRFAGQTYGLNITGYDDQSLAGDVMTLPPRGTSQSGFIPTKVGTVSLSMSEYEGEMLSTGNLIMNGTEYKVLLSSPKPSMFIR